MQRRPWFEIHDHPLFPGFLRDLVTDALEAMWNTQGIYRPVARRLEHAVAESGAQRVIDLCSGSGGPWLRFSQDFGRNEGAVPTVLLTDKYPNRRALEPIPDSAEQTIFFYPESVDAMRIPPELSGFRTMFSTFHHFAPSEARAILRDAYDQRQGIAIFEAAKCCPRTLAAVFAVPLISLRLAPRVRPFLWRRLFWTYCLPAIPFVLWADGILSCLRSYSQADLKELISGMESDDYRWEIGEEYGGSVPISFLVGSPLQSVDRTHEEPVETQSPPGRDQAAQCVSGSAIAEAVFRR